MWSEFKPHQQGDCPIPAVAVFEGVMGNGDGLGPLMAFEADWNCPHDPIVQYCVKQVSEAREITRKEYA